MKNKRITYRGTIQLYQYQIGNKMFTRPELPDGITDYEIIDFDDTPVVEVSDPISKMKLKIQLVLNGISMQSILDTIDLIPDVTQREIIKIKWNDAVYFERNDVELNMMAAMLGITQVELDQIFINGNLL